MIKNIWDSFLQKTTFQKILFVLLSLIFTKSIFIHPFNLIGGFWGIILGMALWAAVFIICLLSLYLLSKVSWKYNKTNVKKTHILLYMIPSLAVSTALLLIFFPGIMSWDSMYIWECVQYNEYSNLHPITYVLFVNSLQEIVDSPWLVIVVQFIYSSFVFAFIGYVFEGMGLNRKICWIAVLALSLYPVNAYQNASMLKDVTYMMSLVLLSALILKILTENKFSILSAISIAVVSLVALFSRHNGLLSIPLALLLLAIYFIAKKNKGFAIKSVIVLAAVIIGFYSTNNLIISSLGNRYWQRSTSSDILMMPSAQLSYTVDKNWSNLTEEQKNNAEKFLDTGYIKFQKDNIAHWQFNNRYLETLNMDEILKNKEDFIEFYFEILKSYPNDMIKEYEQITGIIWSIPNYGYTMMKNVGIPDNYIDIGLESNYLFPKIAEFLNQQPKVLFWLRPALWLMLSLLLLFLSKQRHGLKGLIVVSPALANAAGFLLGTPAQNVRYFYCNFSCFVILFLFSLMAAKSEEIKEA
jgi:hypothetical protein